MKHTRSPRLLYVCHLADQLRAFDAGTVAVDARAFKLFARRLKEATLGSSVHALLIEAQAHPEILHVLASRHFETYGRFDHSEEARSLQHRAEALIARLMAL